MILKDKMNMVEIKMQEWDGNQYTPDWSNDFFQAGLLKRDEEEDEIVYTVDDVIYCVEQALDWERGEGDFSGDDADDRLVTIVDLNGASDLDH